MRLIKLLSILFISCASFAHAEFISINPLCRHITNSQSGSAGVVTIPSSQSGITGLIIYSSKAVLPAQGFSISNLAANEASSIFLKYNKQTKKFTELTVASGKTYQLNGNFSLTMQNIKVNVSYENNKEPYTSIVFVPDNSVVAFTGLQMIVNGKSDSLVSWLGANSVTDSEVITLNLKGELLLGGKVYTSLSIGLPSQDSAQNICMNSGVMYLSTAKIDRVEKKIAKNELSFPEKNQLLMKSSDFLEKNTTVVVLKNGFVVQDGYGQLLSVQPVVEKIFDEQIVCRVEALS